MNISSNNENYRLIIEEIQKNHDPEYTANHDFNIRRGKLLLFLLSTLGEPIFFKWLSSATPKGNHYEFRQYKVMRRAERIKDAVQIDNYKEFKKAVRHFAGKDIDNPDLLTILNEYLANKQPFVLQKAQAFLEASVLLTAKLARFLSHPRYLPGDVINLGDPFEINPVDLIDLYRQQEKLESDQDAVLQLCEKFDIPKDPFEPVKIDKRTHWTQVAYHDQKTEQTEPKESGEFIDFIDDKKFWGRVILKDGKIDDVLTCWTKNLDYTPYRELHVPFTSYLPLWNLNDIRQKGKGSTVILTATLQGAWHADQILRQNIQTQEDKIKKRLEIKNDYGGFLPCFSKKAQRYCRLKLKDKSSNIDLLNELTVNALELYFILQLTQSQQQYLEEVPLYYNFLHSGTWASGCLYDRKKSYLEWKKEYQNINGCTSLNRNDRFDLFEQISILIPQFIEEYNARTKKKVNALKPLQGMTISSWYGGWDTLSAVDFTSLRERRVIFVLKDDKIEDFQIAYALNIFLERRNTRPSELIFALPDTPHFRECSPEELFVEAEEKGYELQDSFLPACDDQAELVDSIDLNDLEKLAVEEAPFLIRPLIRRASITMIYSEPNVGKTFLAQSMAIAMLTGSPLFHLKSSSWEAERPLRVLYIDSEMSEAGFDKRLRMLARFYTGKSKGKIELKRKLVANSNWNLAGEDSLHRDIVSRMLSLGTKEQIDIVFFDNLSTLTFGNDSQKSWMTFFSWLRELADNGIASCCLHHAAKSGEQRGTSLRSATVDNIIRLRKALPGQRRNLALTLTVEKARDVGGEELTPLQIELKCFDKKKDDWRWVTTLARGKSSIEIQERDAMILAAYESGAFSIKILADYFGIEQVTLKQILNKTKKHK